MAIDIKNETIMTLTQASRALPLVRGARVHDSTLWRWCRKGRYGITLEYACIGRTIVTSSEALGRFFIALAQQQTEPLTPSLAKRRRLRPRTSDQRRREIESAQQILIKAKIIQPKTVEA